MGLPTARLNKAQATPQLWTFDFQQQRWGGVDWETSSLKSFLSDSNFHILKTTLTMCWWEAWTQRNVLHLEKAVLLQSWSSLLAHLHSALQEASSKGIVSGVFSLWSLCHKATWSLHQPVLVRSSEPTFFQVQLNAIICSQKTRILACSLQYQNQESLPLVLSNLSTKSVSCLPFLLYYHLHGCDWNSFRKTKKTHFQD